MAECQRMHNECTASAAYSLKIIHGLIAAILSAVDHSVCVGQLSSDFIDMQKKAQSLIIFR